MSISPIDRASLDWRPQGADLYSTGASGAPPVTPVRAVQPMDSLDDIGGGPVGRQKEEATPNRDWTNLQQRDWTESKEKEKVVEKEEEEPPKEPIYKQLLEHIQSMWRASGLAIELAQEINKTASAERAATQARNDPLTYADPKVKKGSST